MSQRVMVGALVCAVLAVATAWSGAARPPATLVLSGVSLLALALAMRPGRPLRLAPVALLPLALAAVALLQLVPLPPGFRAALAPATTRVELHVLAGVAPASAWRPITGDAPATVHQVVRLLGLAALAIACGSLSDERGRPWLRGALVGSLGVLLGLTAAGALGLPVVHAAAVRSAVAFPLANPNHAAALIAAASPIVLAQALRRGRFEPGWMALLVLADAALIATLSRAGIALGLGAQAATLWAIAPHERRRAMRAGAMAAVAVAVVAVALLVARRHTAETSLLGRVYAARDALSMIAEQPVLGVGRGAFPYAFPRYDRDSAKLRHDFVEDEYLQVVADEGLLGAALCALALIVALRGGRARFAPDEAASPRTRAATVALGAVALHNAVDFSWETGAVACAVCALGALAFPGAGRLLRPRAVAVGLGLSALALACAISPLGRTAEADAARLIAARRAGRPAAELAALEEGALRRHPLDSTIADLAAARRLAQRDPTAFDWVERALAVAPHDVQAHQIAARALAWAGRPEQAAGELCLAVDDANDRDRGAAFDAVLAMFPRDEDAERLAAALPVPSDALDRALGLLLQRKRYTLVERVARRALPLAPDAPVVLASLISASLQTGARDGLGEAAAHLAEVDRTPQAILLAANGEVAAGDPAAAEKLLAVALDRGPDLEISVLAARLALERGDPGRAQAILDLALARAVARADKARLHGERALLEDKLGNHARATAERALAAGLE